MRVSFRRTRRQIFYEVPAGGYPVVIEAPRRYLSFGGGVIVVHQDWLVLAVSSPT